MKYKLIFNTRLILLGEEDMEVTVTVPTYKWFT